ncbi:hypothetical protein DRH29_04995 [candidate division Kazan bacterium]|uniref:Uncharacterized protein n=1 Tax=candidate division Kazan bacterium TaxID=2202143 RepID=A0A420ZB99_UNCK3|nr:MAG: hypothetical protein DRH29_04995 [candidate division Kazan bacterium]
MSDEKLETVDGFEKTLAALAVFTFFAFGLRAVLEALEKASLERELVEIMGREWVDACVKDEECNKKLLEIASETLRYQARVLEEDRKKREEFRRKVLEELREKLKELGIEIWCKKKDLGELGEFYEECYIEYKGEEFTIEDLRW